jgi:hypothetical protein
MKRIITNKLNLPEAYVFSVQNDPYDPDDGGERSDYTITGLLKPPRAAQIERTNTLEVDAADMLALLQGQLIHYMLERAKPELEARGFIIEKRFYKKYSVNMPDGTIRIFNISAKIDVFDPVNGRLSDYKYTSTSSASYGLKEEHRLQVNFQSMLVRNAGFKVVQAETVMLMKDWSPMKLFGSYPTAPTALHPVPFMKDDEIDHYIIERIKAHEAAKVTLPLCSDEEKFNRPSFAVIKGGQAKAVRVFKSEKEANTFISAIDFISFDKYSIVKRPGTNINCLHYCPARSICEQAKADRPAVILDEDGFVKV